MYHQFEYAEGWEAFAKLVKSVNKAKKAKKDANTAFAKEFANFQTEFRLIQGKLEIKLQNDTLANPFLNNIQRNAFNKDANLWPNDNTAS